MIRWLLMLLAIFAIQLAVRFQLAAWQAKPGETFVVCWLPGICG